MSEPPLAYFLTFRCYGTWLHGDPRGSTDRDHNVPNTPLLPPDAARKELRESLLRHVPVRLDESSRGVVTEAIKRECEHRGWRLLALNVRTNHVHIVVSASEAPERVVNVLKSWATRRMVEAGVLERGVKAWSRHGRTRYLWDELAVEAACTYTLYDQ